MAQFYQVMSLDELCRLYPNLQVDNTESSSDDKIIQYTDAQGQQLLTTAEQPSVSFRQNSSGPSQQGVYVIETVEAQTLDSNKSTSCSDQPKLLVQQINAGSQTSHQLVTAQQPLILQQIEPGSTESYLYKEISGGENKSQYILQMDQKSQPISQQSQYVIHPMQANVVHVDSSKHESNSSQIHCISCQQDGNKELQDSSTKTTEKIDCQKVPVRQFEGNKLECQTLQGQVDSVNSQQQFNIQQTESSSQKSVIGVGKQIRHLIMQQVDGGKEQSIIVQQLNANTQLSNQILLPQIKSNKCDQTLLPNVEIAQKDSSAVKFQNIDNTHFIMQKLDGSKPPPIQYQTQHFIVPQGEKLQPKIVLQRLEVNKQIPTSSQLIVQQFQTTGSNQPTQYVVQHLDVNKQNFLPYLTSAATKHSTHLRNIHELEIGRNDLKGSQPPEQGDKLPEKEEEKIDSQLTSIVQGVAGTAQSDGVNRQQDTRQDTIYVGQIDKSHSSTVTPETVISRLNYHAQTIETAEPRIIVQRNPCEPFGRFLQHEIGSQAGIRPQTAAQQPRFYNTIRVIDNYPSQNVTIDQSVTSNESVELCQRLNFRSPEQQNRESATGEKLEQTKLKKKDSALQSDEKDLGLLPNSTTSASNVQSRRLSIKQGESDNYPSGLFIVPKGDGQVFVSQCETGMRFQGPQQFSHVLIKQKDVESNSCNDKTSQTGDLHQNTNVKNSTSVTPAFEGPQKLSNSDSGLNSCESRDLMNQPFVHPGSNVVTQTVSSQCQNPNEIILKIGRGGGRGSRGGLHSQIQRGSFRMQNFSGVARGVQLQSSAARLSLGETVSVGRKSRDFKGGPDSGTSGWTCAQSQSVGSRPIVYQLANVNSPTGNINNNNNQNKNSTNDGSNTDGNHCSEGMDETRMLVLLPNGERRLVRFPTTQQNLQLGQLWQQVRFSLGSQISIVSTDHVSETNNAGQILIKGFALDNQENRTSQDNNACQAVTRTTNIQNQGGSSSPALGNIQQQRPRGVSPRMINATVGSNTARPRIQCTSPRMSTPRVLNPGIMSTPQHNLPQNALVQSSAVATVVKEQEIKETSLPSHLTKEAPKYVAGFIAICPFCGILSLDFNKCIRCRRKLPENVKSQSIVNVKKIRSEKATLPPEEGSAKSSHEDKHGENQSDENKEKLSSPVCDKKKVKPSPKKKKIADEPAEILILSSDDEEDSDKKNTELACELTALSKEPVYGTMILTAEDIASVEKGNSLVDELMENFQPGSFTTFFCKIICIGSYKIQPKERVFISTKGIKLTVPSLKSENTTIAVPISEILKLLVHFGKQLPIVFIYASPKMSVRIRTQLGMDNKNGPYYDPTAVQDETHKRITLILDKISEDNKIALQGMFKQNKLVEELSEKEANEILMRASPSEEQTVVLRSLETVRKIMIYPPPPEKGGIALNNQDYACLGEDQFLNDVIIDFYLKYLLLKVLSPEDRERTHVFSTFFYKRLTTKPKTMRKNDPENDPKLSPAEKRHMRVKGWTKQVNLFEKDFIIVPINEHSHWFLAIICFPGLSGPVKFSDNSPVELEDVQPKKNAHTVQIGNTTITHIVKCERNSVSLEMDPGSDRDEAEGDQDDLHPSSDDEESEQTEEESASSNSVAVEIPLLCPSPQSAQSQTKETKGKHCKRRCVREPIKQPCILIFDSLAGASRVRVVATLRDYLKIEYKKKMGQDREFTKDTIKGAVPKVPQQNNFTDCGLYVLQYVESFFQDPLYDFKLPLKYLQDWFPEEVVSCKRQELACLIRSLMKEQGLKVDEMGLPTLTFTTGSNIGEEQAKIEEDEEEEEEEEEGIEDEEIKGTTEVAEFDNDEEEDMDLEDEEEQMEGEDEDEEDEEMYEELEVDEIQKAGLLFNSPSGSELETEGCRMSVINPNAPLSYNPTGSDEEGFPGQIAHKSSFKRLNEEEVEDEDEEDDDDDIDDEDEDDDDDDDDRRNVGQRKQQHAQVTDSRKSVPLTEFQDFESQISCTTIEKNVENVASESDMAISEGEEDIPYESSVKVTSVENVIVATNSIRSLDRKTIEHREKFDKEKKAEEFTNMISKLVSEKSITVCRKEDGSNLRKQLDYKPVKVNCDKSEENNASSMCESQNANSMCVKRTFETLKSVRIPKKTERASFLNKRQKVDET